MFLAQFFIQAPRHAPLAACAAVLLAAAVLWLYPRQVHDLRGVWRWALPAIRGFALAALVGSLVKPVAVRPASASERGSVLLLIDRSRSMGVIDNARSTAQLVALADALGKLPPGARVDSAAPLLAALDYLRVRAADVKAALDDLDYARVSGRDIDLRQNRLREALGKYAEASKSLASRADSVDPESDLRRRLEDLAPVPSPDAREAWRGELPAKIARAADSAAQHQSAADEQLYLSRPDVRSACDELSRLSRFALVRQAVLGQDGALARLRIASPVSALAFADELLPLELPAPGKPAPAFAVTANGTQTDLVRAVAQAVARRNARAVVLFSDGRQVGGDPSAAPGLGSAGVPVFTVAAAPPAAPRDLSFAEARAPSSVFAGQSFPVKVELRHDGMGRADVDVHLESPDSPEQVRRIAVQDSHRARTQFTLRLSRPGAQKLRLWFAKTGNEISDANNHVERWVKVVPRRMKVMVVAGSPGWDFQFVRAALSRAAEIEATEILIAPGGKLAVGKGVISEQDVVVLFDPPAGALDGAQWDEVEQLAERKGGSVILVAGSHLPAEYGKASPIPVSKLLPYRVLGYTPAWRVWPGESPEFHFVPAPRAEGMDVLRLGDPEGPQPAEGGVSRWEQLPGAFRFVQLPEGSDRDASNRNVTPMLIESESRLPVLTEMRLGAGRAFFLGTDETWRWRFKTGGRDQDRFWRQLVTYASDQPYFARSDPLALDADKVAAEPGELVRVRARLTDERLGAGPQELEILRDGKPFATRPLDPAGPSGSGRFAAGINLPAGEYTLLWSTRGQAGKAISVRMPLHVAASEEAELADLSGDERSLRKIAEATGGEFLTLEQINTLPGRVAAAGDARKRTAELTLWDSPYLFCFVLGCLGAEWAIRKRLGLA